jgi:ABC-type branched-subunit amino acid transport system ATPase component
MLLDEPTLGLAPLVFREIFRIIDGLRGAGQTILMRHWARGAARMQFSPRAPRWRCRQIVPIMPT